MIQKTVRTFKRQVPSYEDRLGSSEHLERVREETWWLFGFIPLYQTETIEATTL